MSARLLDRWLDFSRTSSLIISDLENRVLIKKENGNKEEAERGGLEDIEEGDEIEVKKRKVMIKTREERTMKEVANK